MRPTTTTATAHFEPKRAAITAESVFFDIWTKFGMDDGDSDKIMFLGKYILLNVCVSRLCSSFF